MIKYWFLKIFDKWFGGMTSIYVWICVDHSLSLGWNYRRLLDIVAIVCIVVQVRDLFFFSISCDLQELIVESIFVAHSVVLLQAWDQTWIVLQNHVLQNTPLIIVQDAFFWHFWDDSEEHARFRPNMSCEESLSVMTTIRLLRETLLLVMRCGLIHHVRRKARSRWNRILIVPCWT